jgi:hypothetical protein
LPQYFTMYLYLRVYPDVGEVKLKFIEKVTYLIRITQHMTSTIHKTNFRQEQIIVRICFCVYKLILVEQQGLDKGLLYSFQIFQLIILSPNKNRMNTDTHTSASNEGDGV